MIPDLAPPRRYWRATPWPLRAALFPPFAIPAAAALVVIMLGWVASYADDLRSTATIILTWFGVATIVLLVASIIFSWLRNRPDPQRGG